MTEQEALAELLVFFKALSDENRLKIVGLLAQRPYSVEKLADALGMGVSTTSHHLSRLAKAGLVTSKPEGHYYIYSLKTEVLKEMTQRLLHDDTLPKLTTELSEDEYDRKVLAAFLDESGRVKAFPSQEKKFAAILRHCVKAFEPGVRYTEKQVNEILQRFNKDTAALRRGMIEYKMMERESNGSAYWRPE